MMARKHKEPFFSFTVGRKPKSHILHTKMLCAVLVLVVGLFTSAVFLDRYISQGGSSFVAAVISATLVDLTNDDRAKHEIGDVKVNPLLVAAAQAKANDMAQRGYFAHNAPDGKDPWFWFNKVGYDFLYAGENLAVHFSESADVERAWMNSPAHRDNILNSKYTEIGVATAVGMYQGQQTLFVVQMFGKPRAVEASELATQDAAKALEASPVASAKIPSPPGTANGAVVLGETVAQDSSETQLVRKAAEVIPVLESKDVPAWAYMISQPKSTLRIAYYIIGLCILFALLIDIELEIKWHHFKHAMRAGFVLATMSMLFIVADWAFFAQPILAAAWRLL